MDEANGRANTEEIRRFWRHLFSGADEASDELYLVIASGYHGGEDDDWIETPFPYPKHAEAAAKHALARSEQGRETYFCAHLLTKPKRNKGNAAPLRTLYTDQDEAVFPNGVLSPTAVLRSSEGRKQGFLRLDVTLEPGVAEELNRRLTRATGADPSGYDLSQLLRVPGTSNHKYGAPQPVEVELLHAAREAPYREVEAVLPPPEPGTPRGERVGHGATDEPPVRLDARGLRIWSGDDPKYKDGGEIDRSESLYKIGAVLGDAGATERAVAEALRERDAALGWNKYTDRADDTQYATIAAKVTARHGPAPGQPGGRQETSQQPSGGGDPGLIKRLADEITAEDHFARDAGEKLYRFSGGTYRQYAERYLRRRVKELLERWGESQRWSSHRANEVVEYIRADAPELWERPPLHEVNVLNGILNIEREALRAHDPAFLSPVQVPVTYDPAARCPAWEKFVGTVFPGDAQELAFELAADLITPSRSAQKAILLLGEGSNGKSTYLRALAAFVGSTNAAGVSLHKLESDRFAASRLIGKLANICPDLPSAHLAETSAFKAITGGDDLHAEYKYRESFEFRPYCRLVFSANQVPRSGDATHAFFRRWLVVPFNRTFTPEEEVPREILDASLADPAELSGVLNRALNVIDRVRREGFTESESMQEAWEEFKAMTDPVSVWLENNTVIDANAMVPKGRLLAAYNATCEEQGRSGMTATAFGLAIKRARPGIEDAQRTITGKPRVKVWLGIGLRGHNDETPDDETPDDEPSSGGDATGNPGNPRNPVPLIVSSLASDDDGEAKNNNRENRVTPVTSVTKEDAGTPRADPHRPLTREESVRVRGLIHQGMSPAWARRTVLAGDHPLDCECEVCA